MSVQGAEGQTAPQQFDGIAYVTEVNELPIGDNAKAVEKAERIREVRQAIAWRALDIATDPNTPQWQVRAAEALYRQTGVLLLGEQPAGATKPSQWNNYPEAPSSEHIADRELTPEQRELRETLLAGVTASHATYEVAMIAINERRRNKLNPVHLEDARAMAEAYLTDDVVRELYAQLEGAKRPEIERSPRPGFDLLFIPNETLTTGDEDAVAVAVQKAVPAYSGTPYVYRALHSNPHQKNRDNETGVSIVIAPRHLNLPTGTVTEQNAAITTYNKAAEANRGATALRSADDLEAMVHNLHSIRTNPAGKNWNSPNVYDERRFWATYHRNVQGTPVAGGFVPHSYVNDDGRFNRNYSLGLDEFASRALVVTR